MPMASMWDDDHNGSRWEIDVARAVRRLVAEVI
jgi:hypothetical protein